LDFLGIVFQKETRGPRRPGPPWTSGHCRAQELSLWPLRCPRGEGEEGRAGEFNGGVAAAREAVEGRLTGGGALSQEDDGEGALRAKGRSVGGVGGFTEDRVGFYRAEARRGRAERLQWSD
jgi:hypothetical protein